MSETGIDERVAKLEAAIQKLERPAKDWWDKFSAVSTFLSGILIGGIGIYATATYNARQLDSQQQDKVRELKLQQVQTVEKFFPHLSSEKENVRRAALETIAVLGDETLAVRLASYFGGEAGTSVLAKLSTSSDLDVAAAASSALAEQFARLRGSVAVARSNDTLSTAFFVTSSGLALMPSFALGKGALTLDLPSGRSKYPAVVVQQNEQLHLALVKASIDAPVVPITSWHPDVKPGDRALVLAFARGAKWVSVAGRITEILNQPSRPARLATDIASAPGFAGAPVVDEKGRLLGMAESRDESGRSLVIPSSQIGKFLEQALAATREQLQKEQEALRMALLEERSGTGGSGIRGYGPRAHALREKIAGIEADLRGIEEAQERYREGMVSETAATPNKGMQPTADGGG